MILQEEKLLHNAVIQIPMDAGKANMVAASLAPEARSDTEVGFAVEACDDGLRLSFHADDAAKLRAALNSYVRLAMVAIEVTE